MNLRDTMHFGVTLPNLGVGDDPNTIVDLAVEAELAGWDAVFVWDTPYASDVEDACQETFDAWVLMSAIAERTERVRIGTMITALPWRRPWQVARQSMTLDRISGGRFVLCVGLGWVPPGGSAFNEEMDRRKRARMLNEGLDVLAGLWSGERFSFMPARSRRDTAPGIAKEPWPRPSKARHRSRKGTVVSSSHWFGEPIRGAH